MNKTTVIKTTSKKVNIMVIYIYMCVCVYTYTLHLCKKMSVTPIWENFTRLLKKLRLQKKRRFSVFYVFPASTPYRPIHGDQTRILDFQQLCLGSVVAASNRVQSDPAFSLQHSRRSQKLFLDILGASWGLTFWTICSMWTRDIMHTLIVFDINPWHN